MGTLRSAFILVALLGARSASADTDIELADKLFAEGLALRDVNPEQSCNKFRESLDKNPQAIGTLMNVALCDQKAGRIASAWEKFAEARDRAKEGNLPEYLEEAQKQIEAIERDLPYVEIQFVGAKQPGTRVLIGDRVMPIDKIDRGEKIAVDPGELVIVVSAPGRLAYETKMMIGKQETKPIVVPELKKGVTIKSSRKTIGMITTISGGGLVATSIVLGLVARSRYNAPFDDGDCNRDTKLCEADAQVKTENARTLGWVGTFVGVAGVATAGVGVYLWLTAPKESKEKRLSLVPTITPETAGLTAVGRF